MAAPPFSSSLMSWWDTCRLRLRRVYDRISVVVLDRHTVGPAAIGDGQHDCALASLYWAVPSLREVDIVEAFNLAAASWPYGGVSNKEFAIALRRLGLDSEYSREPTTLGALLSRKPTRCVALVHGHFIAIVNGVIVGRDARCHWAAGTHVYCHWAFNRRLLRPA